MAESGGYRHLRVERRGFAAWVTLARPEVHNAFNAALIAGSKPDERLEKLTEFWSRVQNDQLVPGGLPNWMATATRNVMAITAGRIVSWQHLR